MSPTPSYRAFAALLLVVSCNRSPSPAAQADSARADSSMAAGVPAPAPAPADSPTQPVAQAPAASPAPVDTPATTKPSKPATSSTAKPSATPKPQTPTQTASAPAAPAGDAPLRDAYHTAPLDTVDAKTYQGWKLFNLNCSRCHGEDVNGTTIAPHLIVSLKPNGPIPDEATFQTTVCGGRIPKGMPSWCALGMTPGTIDTIYAYVKGRSDAKIHPGRPAQKS